MKELFEPHVIISLAVIAFSLSMVAIVLIIVLRDKISGIHVSRSGVEIRTNDTVVWSKIVDKIERIDASASNSIRKATTRLMILDPEKYGMSAEVMLAIEKANLPLIYAAYENHHTRKLEANADVYISDKAYDIFEAVQIWRKHFPELTGERTKAFAYHWLKTILLPALRLACVEKVTFYATQIERRSVSNSVKEMLLECRDKNSKYIKCIDKLAACPDISGKSSVFLRGEQNKRGEL